MNIKIDIRVDDEGRKYIHFPFMSVSDLHLGTKQSRAKRTSSMFQHIHAERLHLVGDYIDGEHLQAKASWNLGPWHRQVMGHNLRRAAQGADVRFNPGNHEEGLQSEPIEFENRLVAHRRLQGKSLYGVKIEDQSSYIDPKGRKVLSDHGHRHERHLYDTLEEQARSYRKWSKILAPLYQADHLLSKVGLEFSIAALSKHIFKDAINENMGVRDVLEKAIDAEECDIYIYGHTHMGGFQTTPAGKMIINDGTCTEHVQFAACDDAGNWAICEFHRNRLIVTELDESGQEVQETISWAELGLDHFSDEPILYDDIHTDHADRLSRLFARMWPAQDRQVALADKKAAQAVMRDYATALSGMKDISLMFKLSAALYDPALKVPIPKPAKRPVTPPVSPDASFYTPSVSIV